MSTNIMLYWVLIFSFALIAIGGMWKLTGSLGGLLTTLVFGLGLLSNSLFVNDMGLLDASHLAAVFLGVLVVVIFAVLIKELDNDLAFDQLRHELDESAEPYIEQDLANLEMDYLADNDSVHHFSGAQAEILFAIKANAPVKYRRKYRRGSVWNVYVRSGNGCYWRFTYSPILDEGSLTLKRQYRHDLSRQQLIQAALEDHPRGVIDPIRLERLKSLGIPVELA